MPPQVYTKQTRHEWFIANLARIENTGLGYRDIALELKAQFGLKQPPSTATIGRSLKEAKEDGIQPYSPEALRLLQPENFPEFRELFPAPGGGVYQTNKTHHALHWVVYAFTRKVDLPDWVVKHLELPEDINQDITLKEKMLTFILLLAPRHGKTMTIIHSLISLIAYDPNVRIIYSQGVQKTTQKIMALIMAEMEFNEKLKSLYGPFEGENSMWSRQDGFIVARRDVQSITPTFLPAGINVNVRSLDADIIIIDDPQDLDRAESETTTRKDYNKITTEFMTRREPHTPVLMIGSHLPTLFGDVFTQLEDNLQDLQTEGQAILLRKRPAHNLESCSVVDSTQQEHWDCLEWPEFRNWNFLEAQRALLGEELYEAVYQQVARIPGARPFPPEIVRGLREEGGVLDQTRSWKEQSKVCPRCDGKLYTTLGFDPAAGEGKRASYSALVVLDGCQACRTLFVIDYWMKRQSPELHSSTIASFAKSFDVMYVRVEINAYQKALARDLTLRDAARAERFVIDEHMTDDRKNTPEFGIPNLSRYMSDDKFSVPAKTREDVVYGKEWERAFVRYPQKPNDVPMAAWLAAGMMWEVWDMYVDTDPIYLPGRETAVPQYMLESPLSVNLALYGNNPD